MTEYKRIGREQILRMREKTNVIASNTAFIAIFSMRLNCYNLNAYGAKGGISARANALTKMNYAFMYSGNRKSCYNICWFAIPVHYQHYLVNKNVHALRPDNEVPHLTVQCFKDFYNITDKGFNELKD
jgi:hypothetical protein